MSMIRTSKRCALERLQGVAAVVDGGELKADPAGELAATAADEAVADQGRDVRVVLDDEDAEVAGDELGVAVGDALHERVEARLDLRRADVELDADALLLGRLGLDPLHDAGDRERLDEPREGQDEADRRADLELSLGEDERTAARDVLRCSRRPARRPRSTRP